MTLHVRAQLRRAVAVQLAGLPTTAERVYLGRMRALGADHLPTLLVYTDDEETGLTAMGSPALQERRVMLMVEARAKGTDSGDLQDLLDAIAAEVEPAILNGPTFGGLATLAELTKTRTRIEDRAERLDGGLRLEFRVHYQTAEGRPTEAIID
ncbi:hypothetical protein [Reyranella sp.]|uniref:hypothetical protein n=1 Tax=Reyranella sp. TaxID=1929291 RepID=UPI003C7C1DA4